MVIIIIQPRDDCNGENNMWLDSGYIFNIEPVRFVDEFNADFERKEKAGKSPRFFV